MDPQSQTGLGADDYQALFGMMTSSDAGARAQATALAKKMTPDEQQGFFDFQQQANRGKDTTSQRLDSNMIGWGTSGAGIAPEDVLAGGMAGRAVVGAVRSGGAGAAITEAITQASPYVKFTVAKHTLEAAGVPSIIAEPAAYFISGYKRGKPTVAEPGPVDAAAPHLDTSVPVKAGDLTPAQLAERMRYGRDVGPRAPAVEKPPLGRVRGVSDVIAPDAGTAAPAAAPLDVPAPPAAPGAPSAAPPSTPALQSPAPTNAYPDQRAINEAALAQRRAAYQARVQALAAKGQPQPPSVAESIAPDAPASAAATPAPARIKLTAPESKEYLRLRQLGKTDPEAMQLIQGVRDFQAQMGLTTTTPVRTDLKGQTFPKGWRGQ